MDRYEAEEFARALVYAADCIRYYERVSSYNDCNNCGKKTTCRYAPKLGETTRINCPLWESKDDRPRLAKEKCGKMY